MLTFMGGAHGCLLLVAFALVLLTSHTQGAACLITTIYQFGDSSCDTGNAIRIPVVGQLLPAARPPYGESFPGNPTGRWSDGRLIIDYEAIALGLTSPIPSKETNSSTNCGSSVNFAVAGGTAQNLGFFTIRGIAVPAFTVSLSQQIASFKEFLRAKCSKESTTTVPGNAIIFIGEIGGNDIFYALSQGKTFQEVRGYLPSIAAAIINSTKEVIRLGAKHIVVTGNFAIGCFPSILSWFNGTQPLDNLGCVSSVNDLTVYLNQYLQDSLNALRCRYPKVTILYTDYYNSFITVFRQAQSFGFAPETLLTACCGSPPYNYLTNLRTFCGSSGAPLCPVPSKYIFWDGLHLTQEAYRRISAIVLADILPAIGCFEDRLMPELEINK